MFLTKSIRRKLVLGLSLVLLMLGMMAVAALAGYLSYRSLIHEIDDSLNRQPHRSDLTSSLAALFGPLLVDPPGGNNPFELPQQLRFDPEEWGTAIQSARQEIREYRRRLELLPSKPATDRQRQISHVELLELEGMLNHIDQMRLRLAVEGDREAVLDHLVRKVARLLVVTQKELPNTERGLKHTLQAARSPVWSRFWWTIGIGVVVLVPTLLISLIRCGYAWVFVPIRKLHEVASRVANGDYRQRLTLPGRDEMVILAERFNLMIEHFEKKKEQYDHDVKTFGEQLLRAKELNDDSTLAYGIAHEINNPMSAISMAADSLMDQLNDPSRDFGTEASDRELLHHYLNMIQRESARCKEITTRTLEFARNRNSPKCRQDLTKIVGEVLEMVAHLRESRGHTILFDRTQPHPLDVHAGGIKQVLLNLITNSLEAMEQPGTLTIEIGESVDEVVLTVRDTGCGMTPEVLASLYKPFFTRRKSGKGTGLGLSIVHRIVDEHGGRIEASSDGPDCGSTFRIHLPRGAATSHIAA